MKRFLKLTLSLTTVFMLSACDDSDIIIVDIQDETRTDTSTDTGIDIVTDPSIEICTACVGYNLLDINEFDSMAKTIQQADGKFIMVGATQYGSSDFEYQNGDTFSKVIVARFNNNGSIDTSWGTEGVIVLALGIDDAHANTIMQQSDGKIVIGGSARLPQDSPSYISSVLIRFNIDGSLDSTFDGDSGAANGIIIAPPSSLLIPREIVQQDDGKIIILHDSYRVARLNIDGSSDNSFETNAIYNTGYRPSSMLLQNDGKLAFSGLSRDKLFGMARIEADGSLDNTFSDDGIKEVDLGFLNDAEDFVQLKDGNYIGVYFEDGLIKLVCVTEDGILDTTYGVDGVAESNTTFVSASITSMSLQVDGKIVVTGLRRTLEPGHHLFIARFNQDGSLDTTLIGDEGIGNGIVVVESISEQDYGRDVIIQTDDKIVVAGQFNINTPDNNWNMGIVRFNPDGTLDSETFGSQQ